ncbi:iron uptake system protein EfeO [Roseixanthobacter glucoisosaccharinicivorans]|uniref:iron uptake system protein EfeO n=1 Tax=Roseixanthobacter glucoisosaccharinicivorans TaxID=3119923 RepID=UPI00372B3774
MSGVADTAPKAASPAGGPPAPSRKAMRLAIAGSGLLLVIAFAAFYWATSLAARRKAAENVGAVAVIVTDSACEPMDLTVPAGRTTFAITNRSNRVMEWEILDGVMVVEERENIAPGITQTIAARLAAGTYDITCGLLSNPRGKLHVTPATAGDAEPAAPALLAFIGPLAEYQVQLLTNAGAFAQTTATLAQAVQAGDLERARALYGAARLAYARLAPAADLFADLDTRLDARAADFGGREQDPLFTGLHRVEYGLFAQGSTAGLRAPAETLAADAGELDQRMATLQLQPERMVSGAARLMRRAAGLEAAGGAETYAHSDLADIQAEADAVLGIAKLLGPLAQKASPGLPARIEADGAALSALLAAHRDGAGFSSFETVAADQRAAIAAALTRLGDDMDTLGAALGLTTSGRSAP